MTPTEELSDAVWRGDRDTVDRLIVAGIDVNESSHDRWPPLHLAIEQQWVDIVERLVAAGADVNRALNGGWTPLAHVIDIESDAASQAQQAPSAIGTVLTELLLRLGATPDDEAFEIARNYGNENALRLLEQYQSRR